MKLLDFLEYAVVRLLLALLRRLGPIAASNLAGRLARLLGPLLPVSLVAGRNFRAAMPGLGRAERRRLIRAVWENLGRTAGELPFGARKRVELAEDPRYINYRKAVIDFLYTRQGHVEKAA